VARRRRSDRARADLIGALVSYLRVESESDSSRVRARLPDPADATEAVAAARAAYEQVAQAYTDPLTTRAPLNLGIYLAEHNPADARPVLERVVAAGPREHTGEANAWLGVVLAGLGETEAAMTAHRAAIESDDPFQSIRAMINLGELHTAAHEYTAAREILERAAAVGHPTMSPRAKVALAGVFLREGDLDAARVIYEESLASADPQIVHVATQNLRYIEADDGDEDRQQRAWRVFEQLVRTPCWYQTRAILTRYEAMLPELAALLREATDELPPGGERDDLVAFLELVTTANAAGVEAAIASKSGLPDEVPAELRVLVLRADEASDRFVSEGGQASLDDARSACVALVGHEAWAWLAPETVLDGLRRVNDVLRRLFEHTGEVEYLDLMMTTLAAMVELAASAGEDPAEYEQDRASLGEFRRRAGAFTALVEFLRAVPAGEAASVLADHPDLLDDDVLTALTDHIEQSTEDNTDFLAGIAVLRLCRAEGVDVALGTVGPEADRRIELLSLTEASTDEIRDLLHANPVLVDRATEILLSQFIEAAERVGEDPAPLIALQELLRRSREIGIDTAVEEVAAPLRAERAETDERAMAAMDALFDAMGDADDLAEVVARHRDVLLDDRTDASLTRMIADSDDAGDEGRAAFVQALREYLRKCRIFGSEDVAMRALAELITLPGTQEETFRRLLVDFPALLLPVADDLLADLAVDFESPEGPDRRVTQRRTMLRDTRELGVDQAMVNAWWAGALLPDDLRELLTRGTELNLRLLEGEQDLDVSVWEEVVAHPALADRPWPAVVNEMYGSFNLFRHRNSRVEGAIELAVNAFADNVERSPDEPALSRRLQFLADALLERYELRGHPDDLRRANEALARQAALPERDGEDAVARAKLLLRSYDRFGTATDLDQAIEVLDTPTVYEDDVATMNLAALFNRRFRRDGTLADLDRAISIDELLLAREVTRPDLVAAILANAGMHLSERFEVTADRTDLERGIELLRRAVAAPGSAAYDHARFVSALGIGLTELAGLTGRRADANAAISSLRSAVAATDVNSFEYANRLNNLGAGYLRRALITGRTKHLNDAISTFEAALTATAADAPSHAWRTTNLAQALEFRGEWRADPRDLERATTLLRDSTTRNLDVNVVVALRTAMSWGDRVAARSDWQRAAEAYLLGLEASERLFRAQGVRGHKETWLRETGQLFPNAAHAFLRVGDATAAVQAFDLGRARLLSEVIERDRTAVDRLVELGHEGLHDRFVAAVARVYELESRDR
jgi:tetratricopeptide (TPR) repeat protein